MSERIDGVLLTASIKLIAPPMFVSYVVLGRHKIVEQELGPPNERQFQVLIRL